MTIHVSSIIILLLLSAFFSSAETAFTSLSFLQIKMLSSERSKCSKMTASLASRPDLLLTTILVGNNIVNLSASALTTTLAISLWGNSAIGFATGVLTFLILIFGEITPKHLAITYNTSIAKFASYPIKILSIMLFPVIIFVQKMSSLITRLFAKKEEPTLSLESLMHVVDVAEHEGVVDEYETNLVQRVLHFGKASLKSVMTHRTEVFSLPANLPLREALPQIIDAGYLRIPVYEESPENITGILLLRDILSAGMEGDTERPLHDFVHEPIFVPETRKVDDMLLQFKKEKLQIAVVLDEYGGLSGIVTVEDIVEQLFGELYDEHESGEVERIRSDESGAYIIKADTTMQQIHDELDLEIEEEISGTLAAYIMEKLGTIPSHGEMLELSFGSFAILSMKGKRIDVVKFIPKPTFEET